MNSLVSLLLLVAAVAGQTPDPIHDETLHHLEEKVNKLLWMYTSVSTPEVYRYVHQLNLTYHEGFGYASDPLHYSHNNVTQDGQTSPAMSTGFWLLPQSQKIHFWKNQHSTHHIHWMAGHAPVRVYFLNETEEEIYYRDMGDVLFDPKHHMLLEVPPNVYVAFEVLSDTDYALLSVSASPAERTQDYQQVEHDALVKKYPHLHRIIDHVYSDNVAGYTYTPRSRHGYYNNERHRQEFDNNYNLYHHRNNYN